MNPLCACPRDVLEAEWYLRYATRSLWPSFRPDTMAIEYQVDGEPIFLDWEARLVDQAVDYSVNMLGEDMSRAICINEMQRIERRLPLEGATYG